MENLKLFYVQASVRVYGSYRKYTAFTIATDKEDAILNVKRKHLNGSVSINGIYAYEYSPLEHGAVFGSDLESR